MDWYLLAEVNAEKAFAPIYKFVHLMLLFFILLLVIGGIITLFISKNITRPIMQLHKGIREINQGNLTYQNPIISTDEMGVFSI